MKRLLVTVISVVALLLTPTVAAHAGQPKTVHWVCEVPGEEPVTFVTAAEAARHGIETANSRAGETFAENFGESCTVE
jgi:hypothetical protein